MYRSCLAARGPRDGAFADAGAFTREPGRVVLHPTAQGGELLIVREQDFPGWEAQIDGVAAPIRTTPTGFVALECPAGKHEVVLTYTSHTPARRAGLVVSVLALCALPLMFRKRSGL
jgi:hypothetical protein